MDTPRELEEGQVHETDLDDAAFLLRAHYGGVKGSDPVCFVLLFISLCLCYM